MNLQNSLASRTYDLAAARPPASRFAAPPGAAPQSVQDAREVHDAFSAFIGETFYGQMVKSMRSTVEKPAYFHGGQAEEMFQSQLDQQLAQEWAAESGDRFAEPMFEQQFPEHARVLREADQRAAADLRVQLSSLRRY